MNSLTHSIAQHGIEWFSGATATVIIAAIVRHRPEWPITFAKLYYWFFDAAQEAVSQRTGQPPPPKPPVAPPVQQEPEANPTQPKK